MDFVDLEFCGEGSKLIFERLDVDVKKSKTKSVYLKTWLFGNGAVVICREDLFIFKLKRVLGHLKPEFFSAYAYTYSRLRASGPRFARKSALRADSFR